MTLNVSLRSFKVVEGQIENWRKFVRKSVKPVYYCKTLNVCVPFILQILRAKQNREIKGREYQLQGKNRTKLLQYFELYGFNLPK